MKNTPIRQMFYDSNIKLKFTKEYYALLEECNKIYSELKEKLKSYPELLELYIKGNEADELFNCEVSNIHFVEGVKLGMRQAFEAVYDVEE